MHLLFSRDRGNSYKGERVHEWNVAGCPMSSEAFAEGPDGVLAAWETDGQVYYARIDPATGKVSAPVAAPGAGKNRRFPAVVPEARGLILLAWSEGVQWGKGGAVAWQVFDRENRPTAVRGRAEGVPVWSLVTAFTRPAGGFSVVY
jgi:hypothetical protein